MPLLDPRLLWEINGALDADPSPELLWTVVAGRDKTVTKPPRSKSDKGGTI